MVVTQLTSVHCCRILTAVYRDAPLLLPGALRSRTWPPQRIIIRRSRGFGNCGGCCIPGLTQTFIARPSSGLFAPSRQTRFPHGLSPAPAAANNVKAPCGQQPSPSSDDRRRLSCHCWSAQTIAGLNTRIGTGAGDRVTLVAVGLISHFISWHWPLIGIVRNGSCQLQFCSASYWLRG